MTRPPRFLQRTLRAPRAARIICCGLLITLWQPAHAQHAPSVNTIEKIDVSVAQRDENLLAYTVTELYRLFRNGDRVRPAAEMTVKTTYRRDTGKSFVILTQSGSAFLLKEVLGRVLDSERLMTQPDNRRQALLTSSNYNMRVKGGVTVEGHACTVVSIVPKRSSPYLFRGDIWVDSEDGSILKLEGVASKSASVLTGAAQVSRRYEKIQGLPMATHAGATAVSWLLGETIIDIDYSDYQMTLRTAAGAAPPPGQAASTGSNE